MLYYERSVQTTPFARSLNLSGEAAEFTGWPRRTPRHLQRQNLSKTPQTLGLRGVREALHEGHRADRPRRRTELGMFARSVAGILRRRARGGHQHHRAMLEKKGFNVERVESGPKGDAGGQVAEGTIAGVIFFRDPMGKHPHEPDINMLLRLCDAHAVSHESGHRGIDCPAPWLRWESLPGQPGRVRPPMGGRRVARSRCMLAEPRKQAVADRLVADLDDRAASCSRR